MPLSKSIVRTGFSFLRNTKLEHEFKRKLLKKNTENQSADGKNEFVIIIKEQLLVAQRNEYNEKKVSPRSRHTQSKSITPRGDSRVVMGNVFLLCFNDLCTCTACAKYWAKLCARLHVFFVVILNLHFECRIICFVAPEYSYIFIEYLAHISFAANTDFHMFKYVFKVRYIIEVR